MQATRLPPQVVVLTGLPGTGKSTLAERLAVGIGAPAFAGDWLMGALNPYGLLATLDHTTYLAMYYNLLKTLVTRQLILGQSAITDCLLSDSAIVEWQTVTAAHQAQLHVFECICSDSNLHRSRVEGRHRGIPGWHEVGWEHVEKMRLEYPRLTIERTILDAVDSVEKNLQLIHGRLNVAADAEATTVWRVDRS